MARNPAFERPESVAKREASQVFQPIDHKKSSTEYSRAQEAFHDNRERLKAERLAREAVVASGKAIDKNPRNKSRVKQAILREWDLWIKTQPLQRNATERDARKFFLHLKARHSPTPLDFPARGQDRWQIVHDWLVGARRLAGD
jgi:hypothetical protein